MNAFQLIFIPLCVILAVRAVFRTCSRRISRRVGILAILAWGGAAVLIAWPEATVLVASWLGIGREKGRGVDLVFYLAILAGLYLAFYFYGRYRQLETLVTEAIRRQAIDGAVQGSCSDVER